MRDRIPLRVSTLELFFDLVFAFTLTQLTRAIAYVERCYNVTPAAGGADAQSTIVKHAAESGADLMNWGRLPTTVTTRTALG